MARLQTIFGEPTPAAIRRATIINPATGLPEVRNPAPRWIGHGQQLAAKRLADIADRRWPLPPDRVTRQQSRHFSRKGRF